METSKHNDYNEYMDFVKYYVTKRSANYARVVTIVVLIILAGITLNAVIGEGGIIFQARDTRNKISNETTYDNAQLAQLQNELKDNGLYSGIGIIPGTDNGGGSEGGENGTGGGNASTGETIAGQEAITPTISILSGDLIAEGIYQSDITVQIFNEDKTQKIKYVLISNVEEINKELYPSGLVREIEIENGGTLTFTKDGEYAITAYAYDARGNKSQPATLRMKRIVTGLGVPNPPIFMASGTMGEQDYYSSDISVRVNAEVSIVTEKITYIVTGQAKTAGNIGEKEVVAGQNIPAEEVEIENEESFIITADGIWTIKGYVYDKTGNRSELATGIVVAKDTIQPVVGVPIISTGERGEPTYYRSDVTVKIQGYDDITLKKVTYRVTSDGATKSSGTVGDIPVGNDQSVDTGEIDIENNGTFSITADGVWNVTAYSYDKAGNKSEVSSTLSFTRDTMPPVIESFEQTIQNETDFTMQVVAKDTLSGLATAGTYTFYLENSARSPRLENFQQYTELVENTTYGVDVEVKDKAGNIGKYSRDNNGNAKKSVMTTESYKPYLVDVANFGDYVHYYGCTWSATRTHTSDTVVTGTYWNRDVGSKSSTTPEYTSNAYEGWRVLKKSGSGSSGFVTLISGTSTFCANVAGIKNQTEVDTRIAEVNAVLNEECVNDELATKAWMFQSAGVGNGDLTNLTNSKTAALYPRNSLVVW